MNSAVVDITDVSTVLNALEGASDVASGIRLALPALCGWLNSTSGAARAGTARGRWETIARWAPGGAEEPAHGDSGARFLDSAAVDAAADEKTAPAFIPVPDDAGQPSAHRILLVPLLVSGRVRVRLFFIVSSREARDGGARIKAGCIASLLSLWLKKCQAENRLRDLIDFIPDPLMMIDGDERVTVWNPAMEKMSGVQAKEMLGKGDYAHAVPFYGVRRPTASNLILNPDSGWASRYLEFRKEKDTLHALARSEALPGGTMLIASKTRIVYDVTGAPAGSVHMIQDVTHEHELERSLSRTETMYRSISEFAGVGIALLGIDAVHSCNDNFCALMELDRSRLTVDRITRRVEFEDRRTLGDLLARVLAQMQPESFEFVSFLPAKGRRDFKGYAQVVQDGHRPAVHFVIIDITESKEMERRRQLHQMRMYHSDRLTALGTLSAGIAHELNQPLNTIRVITDGLLFGREQGWALDEKELFEDAAMISRQIVRMSQVIKNIRRFARDDKDQHPEAVDPNEAVRSVLSMIGQQLIAHNITLERTLSPDIPRIQASANHLEQVVMNLVVNARQALDGCEKPEKRIWIKTGQGFGQVFLEVGDNASGIPESRRKEIFDPFFTTKAVGQGTGLGLSISRTIVSDCGGEINAYNNCEGGATFFVTIPVEASG